MKSDRKMKQTIISAFILLWGFCHIAAQTNTQEFQKHEFSVGVQAGMHALKYDLSIGESKNKPSGGIGVGYSYFFKKNMGLATGLDLAFYNTEVKLNDFSGKEATFDIDLQKDFEFRYTLKNYVEKQNAFYINIPVMFHYQFVDQGDVKFYTAAGVKIGIPMSGKYKSSGANLKTEGYYPHNKSTAYGPRFRGFGDFVTKPNNNELKYKTAFSLALEVGAKWTLPSAMALYTGIYFDYGLNDIKKSSSSDLSLVQYNQLNPEDHIFAGVANSSFTPSGGALGSMVDKINTMACGVKVRLAFGK